MGLVNDRQVKTRLGKKVADGSVVYSTLNKIVGSTIPVLDTEGIISFTLGADADVKLLAAGEFPSGNVYIDGTSYEGINGGVACATVAGALGTNEATANNVGGRIVNMVRILDAENDEPLQVEFEAGKLKNAKYVFGMLQTDIAEGQATAADHIQVSFVVYDDTAGAFTAYAIKAGDYKFEPVRMYNLGTVSEVNRLGAILSGNLGLGGVALDELDELLAPQAGYTALTIDAETELDGTKITCNITGATTTEWKDTAGDVLTGTATQSGVKTFGAASVGGVAYVKEGVVVTYNGTEVPVDNVTIKDATTVELDLKDTLFGTVAYEGDRLEVRW
jgi:hypothetical protein